MAFVAFSSFEYLHNELVFEFLRKPLGSGITSHSGDSNENTGPDANVEWRHKKVEAMGFFVGSRIMAHCARNRERKADTLSTVKFICKDFWTDIFHKSVDKLQTNHRGVYVLHDFNFKLLQRLWPSEDPGATGPAGEGENSGATDVTTVTSPRVPPKKKGREERDAATLQAELRNHLAFSCGVIRGAFAQLGEQCVVTHNPSVPPAAQFQIKFSS